MIKIFSNYQACGKEEILALSDKIKALIYARVSTNEQAEKGYSLESQIDKCTELAKSKFGYNDDEILAVVEKGEMGDNPDRPGINHVLYLIEQSVGKKLIMLHPDRMSRYLALQNEFASRVWNYGVDLEFVEFEIDPANPESMLMFNIQGSIAQYNKAKILANTKRGRRQKIKQGKIPGIRRVFGYTYDKEEDILVENPEERQVYLLMVDWLLNGKDGKSMNCSTIARELAMANIPAPSSNKWYQSTISRILRNPIYTGNFYYGKSEVIQDKGKKKVIKKPKEEWQAVSICPYIDENTYLKIQDKLDRLKTKNRGRNTSNYLLKSLANCGICGAAIIAGPVTTLKSGKKLRYYTCSLKAKKNFQVGNGNHNMICPASGWRQDIVDDYVWQYIISKLSNPQQINKVINDIVKGESGKNNLDKLKNKLKGLEEKIRKKEQEKARIFKAYRESIIDLTFLKNELERFEQEQRLLNNERNSLDLLLKEQQDMNKEAKLFEKCLIEHKKIINNELSIEQKRDIIMFFIEKVILHEETIEIVVKWRGDH